MNIKNVGEYNKFLESLENEARSSLFFHRINNNIYITDAENHLLGIWDTEIGSARGK